MIDLAKPGETVFYTGDTSYAVDVTTKCLLNRTLVVGEWYKVVGIKDGGVYNDHYFLEGKGGIRFPPGSFIRDIKEYCRKKYHLK